MIDVYVSFKNAAQIRNFRKKLIRDFRCSTRCSKCEDAEACVILAQFIDDLVFAESCNRKEVES